MKNINGQSSKEESFLLNSRANNYIINGDASFHPCNLGTDDHREQKPLLSYLFFSGDNSQDEDAGQDCPNRINSCTLGKPFTKSTFEKQMCSKTNCISTAEKHIKSRKYSAHQRIKTDINQSQQNYQQQMRSLRRENQFLRQQIIRQQKTIISLQSVQSELEYARKLSFLQQTQIQKLRTFLKQSQLEKLELNFDQVHLRTKGFPEQPDLDALKKNKQNHIFFDNIRPERAGQSLPKNIQKKKRRQSHSKQNIPQPRPLPEIKNKPEQIAIELKNPLAKKQSMQSKTSSKSNRKKMLS